MTVKRVLALVLGGGRGTRLYPLTRDRSKPAVSLAGKYRIIDVPLSNCINSGVQRIYVLTQFNSVSLHRHIRRTYTFDPFSGGFVEILAAQQTLDNPGWYQGTADAVRQNLRYLQQPDIRHVLILSGDQLYRMNYADMLATHVRTDADVTIAAIPVHDEAASALGIMRIGDDGRVQGFLEKPQTAGELAAFRTDPGWIDLATTMNATRRAMLLRVRLPAAMPALASGIRVAAAVAPIGAVVGEWVGSSAGLGYLMLHANARLQIDVMFAALLVLAVFALAVYFLVDAFLRRLVHWQPVTLFARDQEDT